MTWQQRLTQATPTPTTVYTTHLALNQYLISYSRGTATPHPSLHGEGRGGRLHFPAKQIPEGSYYLFYTLTH